MDTSLPDHNKVQMLDRAHRYQLMCIAAALSPCNLYFCRKAWADIQSKQMKHRLPLGARMPVAPSHSQYK